MLIRGGRAEGSPRRALSRGARNARYRWCRRPFAEPLEIRSQAPEGTEGSEGRREIAYAAQTQT